MLDHDGLFKQLLAAYFLHFLALFSPTLRSLVEDDFIELLDKEIISSTSGSDRLVVDLLARLRLNSSGQFILVHIEHQSGSDPSLPVRMFRYFARLREKYSIPVYQIALLSFDRPRSIQPSSYQEHFAEVRILDFRYQVVQLNRLDWRDHADSQDPLLIALLPRMRVRLSDRWLVKVRCLVALSSIPPERHDRGLIDLSWGFIEAYLTLSPDEQILYLKELGSLSSFKGEEIMRLPNEWRDQGIKEGLETGRKQGLEKGLEKGRKEGLDEGRKEGIRSHAIATVMRLLSRVNGPLDPRYEERIKNLSISQLDSLTLALMSFTGQSDLDAWLDSH